MSYRWKDMICFFYYQQLTAKVEVNTFDKLTTNRHRRSVSLYSCFCAKIPSAIPFIDASGSASLSSCFNSASGDLGIKIRHR